MVNSPKREHVPASSRKKLFNCLEDLDRKAKRYKPAPDWTTFLYFLLARYPHLRPKGASDEAEFQSDISWMDGRLWASVVGPVVTKGLSENQREQLAALMLDIEETFEIYLHRKRMFQIHRKLHQKSLHRSRLRRKRERAIDSLTDLLKYANELGGGVRYQYESAVAPCLERLETFGEMKVPARPAPTHFTAEAMVRVYWFFRHGCGLTGDESEVRVGLIRNEFWKEYGVPTVPVREYDKVESKRCPAVRAAVRRFRPSRDTSR